jgi:tRNA (adenine57-N1/adenine58-N1)-methyltransferase catalytic subunit
VKILTERVKKNEIVVLIDETDKRYFVNTAGKTDKIKGIGVFDPHIIVDKRIGSKIEIGSKNFFIFHPSLDDKLNGLKRKAQIILPRDIAQILVNCSVESGHTVLESGIGSGSLTIGLANAVSPNGTVISYDNREDFIKHAIKNLKQAGFEKLVTTKNKDVTKGISEKNLDAIILDIPNPWDAVKHAYHSLKSGGYLCCYSPLISQVEKTVNEIKKYGFILIKTTENIQREMIVSKHGTRPSFNMLGHTGYLTFARKVLL